jgi:Leucine-rich repeat (LRR) protein
LANVAATDLSAARRRGMLVGMARPLAKLLSMLTPKRAWVQFRLKTIFVLVVVVAVPCGLFKWKVEPKWREREAIAELRLSGADIWYDWEFKRNGGQPPGPSWLRRTLGDDFFASGVHVRFDQFGTVTDAALTPLERLDDVDWLWSRATRITDAGLRHIAHLKNLRTLALTGSQVTDAGLKEFAGLDNLKTLILDETRVTDEGLKEIVHLTSLTNLNLRGTHVTDRGMKEITRLTNLSILFLTRTRVTDVGVREISKLKNLRRVELDGTQVTDAGAKELQAALPLLEINR